MAFDGFSRDALKFLAQLAKNNNRGWFNDNRSRYDEALLEPAKEFVRAMDSHVYAISPNINCEPRVNGSIKRISRDTRFARNKAPYKEYFDFMFRYAGVGKEGPGYFLRLTPKEVYLGGGSYMFERAQLPTYRLAVASDKSGRELAGIVKKLKKSGFAVHGEHYKRVPAGFDAGHERESLLRYAGLYAIAELSTPSQLHTAGFTNYCARYFKKVAPLTEWLWHNIATK